MKKSAVQTLQLAALLGGIAVVFGALGAHQLKKMVELPDLAIFEKGVQYQFYHVFALGLLAFLQNKLPASSALSWTKWLWIAGIVGFSGSLYLLSVRSLLPFSVAWVGPITPLGGLCFIAGWVMFARSAKSNVSL
jgi:uncharacterized membrane protein YgdD (TMEM256/DUF423 family)